MISKDRIQYNLKRKIPVVTFDITDSTNTQARVFLSKNCCERVVFAANAQTNGRGRLGRSFYSPADTGIYMTYAFRLEKLCNAATNITTAACVAVARTLDCNVKIKWVNDLYLNGKKICGILTETFFSELNGGTYILVGIGINLTTKNFPDDISRVAGSINIEADKEQMIAAICDNLSQIADNINCTDYLDYYRRHMLGIGEAVVYTENGKSHSAVIVGIDCCGGLIVMENNEKKILCSGEISISNHYTSGKTMTKE